MKLDAALLRWLPAPLQPWRWRAAPVHALLLAGLLAWSALQCAGVLARPGIAESTFDQMQLRRVAASAPDPRILIVDIDEASLADMAAEFGRWPWPRDTLASVLDHAAERGAQAVVFDILFSDPDTLHPGGDRALDDAVRRSRIGFYPVLRLPPRLDARSALGADQLPGLVTPGVGAAPKLALVLPFMRSMVDSRRLGTHTAQLDADGKIRRFAWAEALGGGWRLGSMPLAVARQLAPTAADATADVQPRLIVWRRQADSYPRLPFATLWRCAERSGATGCPALDGRILVIGSSAASLHDIKATPLSNHHLGVDILATLIDNALHGRAYRELPAAAQWGLSAAALLLAYGVVRRGRGHATGQALWLLPLLLLVVGFASLHSEWLYLDFSLPATEVLAFLSAVKLHDGLRRRFLAPTTDPSPDTAHALVCGGPAAQAEALERRVYDLAASQGLRVGGLAAAAGPWQAAHAVWVVWGLPSAAAAAALGQALGPGLPGTWHQAFLPGKQPLHAALQAAASGLPAPPVELSESPT